MNRQGALAGIVVGGATVLIWHTWLTSLGGLFGLYEIVPGVILSTLTIVVITLATPAPAHRPSHHGIHARN
jgi:sodium/proline symporter